jgi:hypothetical protein
LHNFAKTFGGMKRERVFSFAAIFLFLALPVRGADEDGGFFSVTDENDAWSNFFGPHQDRHYTHGTKLTLMFKEHELTNVVVPLWGIHDAVASRGLLLGQNMYTPENILDPNPIPTDRPYAGWLYTGLVYQRRGEFFTNCAVMENFEVNAGVIGPWSFAGQTQRLIHRWRFPEDIPQGWGNQLKNEPGLVLKYARLWRWSPTAATADYFDVIPRAGGELGNVDIFGTAGISARLGINLPPDFGMQIIDSPASMNGGLVSTPRFSIYTFAGVDGRALAHDITLDGNSFRSGPCVEKYNFVNDLSWGLAARIGRHFEISYAQITRSKQFHGQVNKDVFGSIDAKFMFAF